MDNPDVLAFSSTTNRERAESISFFYAVPRNGDEILDCLFTTRIRAICTTASSFSRPGNSAGRFKMV